MTKRGQPQREILPGECPRCGHPGDPVLITPPLLAWIDSLFRQVLEVNEQPTTEAQR